MDIAFTKYHGLGNDYLFIDSFSQPSIPEQRLPDIAKSMCDRRRGIGADGIVRVDPDDECDAGIRIFNSDGSEAETCGNALRCVARLLYESGYCRRHVMHIRTPSRTATARISFRNGRFEYAEINMGRPVWSAASIPVVNVDNPQKMTIEIDSKQYRGVCLSMGNPHCVVFVPKIDRKEVLQMGPRIERLTLFPDRINVGFCKVADRTNLELAVWERGAGWTEACGSGACAAFAAARYESRVDAAVEILLPGGVLNLSESAEGEILMRGPAVRIFSGIWPLQDPTDHPRSKD
ncbi:diaminopimelate epimerase [bacterium]|nr:diaminopimelate epimerase [candidate division CSSED10-310 bacterium]